MQNCKHLKHTSISLVLLGLLAPGLVVAQTPDAGSLLRDIETGQRGIEQTPRFDSQLPPAMPDTGERIVLKSVRFQGYEGMANEAELHKVIEDQIGQSLGFNGLQHLADRITEYLKNKGFFLAFAYLPEQDISQGELLIMIQPGRIEGNGEWQRNDNVGKGINLTDDRIFNTLNYSLRADQNNIIRAQQMERGLLIFNDLAGVTARSNLEKGAEPGTTRVNVSFRSSPRHTANVWVDNYGNRYTGTWRANAMGNINNLSGMGDQLTTMVFKTANLSYGRVAYNAPIGFSGLTANAAISLMQYALGEELSNTNINGNATTFNAGLRYPIIRSRQSNLYATLNYDHKLLVDKTGSTQDKDRQYSNFNLGVNGDKLDQLGGGGLNNYSITITAGNLNRKGNTADYTADQSAAKTHGSFVKANLNGARLQKLTTVTSLLVSGTMQFADSNLDSAEKFALGGPNGVRAYPSGEGAGDEGYLISLEGRYDLPGLVVLGGNIQLNAFIDYGSVTLQKAPWSGYSPANNSGKNSYDMSGAGLGFNWSQTPRYSIKASYAFKLNDDVDNRTTSGKDSEGLKNDGRFWLQAMARF